LKAPRTPAPAARLSPFGACIGGGAMTKETIRLDFDHWKGVLDSDAQGLAEVRVKVSFLRFAMTVGGEDKGQFWAWLKQRASDGYESVPFEVGVPMKLEPDPQESKSGDFIAERRYRRTPIKYFGPFDQSKFKNGLVQRFLAAVRVALGGAEPGQRLVNEQIFPEGSFEFEVDVP
jgi:hypothetical protein